MYKNFKLNYSKKKTLFIRISLNTEINENAIKPLEVSTNYNKIFCIGFGKTGTTSLAEALKSFGLSVGKQFVGEMLTEDVYQKRYDRILNYCYTADAFQDAPFNLPGFYKILDENFPNSKFVLSVRDNAEQWYKSLIRFHSKRYSSDGKSIPTAEDLENSLDRYKGWALDMMKYGFNYPNIPLYDEKEYKQLYLKHIEDVKKYFKDREEDLLILNVSKDNSLYEFANFLGYKVPKNSPFPWLNKT